jgi:hypothetical protein
MVLTNAKIYLEGYDLTGAMNTLDLARTVEAPDRTVFGDSNRRTMAGGLETARFSGGGFADLADDADMHILEANFGADAILTVCPTGADIERAFLMTALTSSIEQGGAVGDIYPFRFEAMSNTTVKRGELLLPKATKTAAGNGTMATFPDDTGATGKWTGHLHIFATDGTGLTVYIKSSSTGAFAGEEVTRVTFTSKTTVDGWAVLSTAGAVTDNYWRCNWAYAGTSVTFAVAFGIEP